MDVRFLDEQDRKEIEGINDISKKEIITNSNSNRDEIVINSNSNKDEIIRRMNETKSSSLLDGGLFKTLRLTQDFTISGEAEVLFMSSQSQGECYITLDGHKIKLRDDIVLVNYDKFEYIYSPNLSIPAYIWSREGSYMTNIDIYRLSTRFVDDVSELPWDTGSKKLYFIKNFKCKNIEAEEVGVGSSIGVYCEYIMK